MKLKQDACGAPSSSTMLHPAGMRLGWLTGSPAMIERMQRIAETDSQEVK